MGNVLCKNRTSRSNSTKNPVDRVIGECIQMCPNKIRKKKHFWEKQVLETAPPEPPLQEQPKSELKNGWQTANLTVPTDHPVPPPRKKRTLQRNSNPSAINEFEDVNLNGDIPETYNERSVDPPSEETGTTTAVTTTTTHTMQHLEVPQKTSRAISKFGNKKSDTFFGESLSDLSVDYEDEANETTNESTQTVANIKKTESNEKESSKSLSATKTEVDIKLEGNDLNKNGEINESQNKMTESITHDDEVNQNSREIIRESVIDLVEDIEEELNRKIIKEHGHLMFAMEKHIAEGKTLPPDDRFKGEEPCVEEIIVPVRKQKRHICDDDEKIREILSNHSENKTLLRLTDPAAPKKPQRDFTKYRKSLDGDDFDTSQIIQVINTTTNVNTAIIEPQHTNEIAEDTTQHHHYEVIEPKVISQIPPEKSEKKEKTESSTQTSGRIAVREKAHHAKVEAENIVKKVDALIGSQNKVIEFEEAFTIPESNTKSPLNSPTFKSTAEKVKNEMDTFRETVEKLEDEIQKHPELGEKLRELEQKTNEKTLGLLRTNNVENETHEQHPLKSEKNVQNSYIKSTENHENLDDQYANVQKKVETIAKHLVDDAIHTAQNCINSSHIHTDFNQEATIAPGIGDSGIEVDDTFISPLNDKINYEEQKQIIEDFIKSEIKESQVIFEDKLAQTNKPKEKIKKDYIQEVMATPIRKLSDKTTAALREAQALKEEIKTQLLAESILNTEMTTAKTEAEALEKIISDTVTQNLQKDKPEIMKHETNIKENTSEIPKTVDELELQKNNVHTTQQNPELPPTQTPKPESQETICIEIISKKDQGNSIMEVKPKSEKILNSTILQNFQKSDKEPSELVSNATVMEATKQDSKIEHDELQNLSLPENQEQKRYVENCVDCMTQDANKVINEVVEYAEKVVNDPKIFKENFSAESTEIPKPINSSSTPEDQMLKKFVKRPSITLFEENNTTDFINELIKDASQTINAVCEYAELTINDDKNPITGKEEITITEKNIVIEKTAEVDQVDSGLLSVPEQPHFGLRPNRISEISLPTQIPQTAFRRSISEKNREDLDQCRNDEILDEILSGNQEDEFKTKLTSNILENGNTPGLPPRPARKSEIGRPSMINPEKILRRCLSTQSYLTPNLIEKIAIQANILAMPELHELAMNDGSSLVSPSFRLESRRSVLSQSSLNSEKLNESDEKLYKIKSSPPPLPPKKPKEPENKISFLNDENILLNKSPPVLKSSKSSELLTPFKTPSPPQLQERKLLRSLTSTSTITTTNKSPLTARSPSPARPSRIPELPKSKLTKRLNRSTSKQSNPDLTQYNKSQELSETLRKFLSEKDLRAQEILDLMEFEFGDCMFSELLPEDDRIIINELKAIVKRQQQQQQQLKLSPPQLPPRPAPPRRSPPSRSSSREHLTRRNSQSSDSSSSKKSPDRLRSRIPVLKSKFTTNDNQQLDFRRHSIDDLDSWFNPHKLPLGNGKGISHRKRENSLQLDFNSEEMTMNSLNSSLTEKNVAIKQFLDNKPFKTKSATDLTKCTSISFTTAPQSIDLLNIDPKEHSALLKYLESKKLTN